MTTSNPNIVLFDVPLTKTNLLPLSYTRPVSDLRVGIMTLAEKWESLLPGSYSNITDEYLSEKFPASLTGDDIFIASDVV
ncbi:MAG: glucose-1-phosphate thymidylyltransferase, partial [Muribaculaceae bacterium]|nr:glucose-1-phosphate thymidylyltransferase [Muribaculaceae bacterium]